MIAQWRAEVLKLRTTRTNVGLGIAMVVLVLFVVLLHGFALPVEDLSGHAHQLQVLGEGQRFGTLFAALLGALSVTGEFRHGTIRPTFLVTPRRGRVIAAKVGASMLLGILFGLVAGICEAIAGSAAFAARGLEIRLDSGDYVLLLAGAAAGAALWTAIGVGLGALVRNQVAVVVGLTAWLLFIEGLLFGDIGLSSIGRFLPGALAQAAIGMEQQTLLTPSLAVFLLALYALVAASAGWVATSHRDVV